MSLDKILFTIPHHLLFGFIGILGIGFLIGIHELGHFLFAKLFHVHTPSFSIGFGPRLFSKKIGSTVFSLSAIPLGGYVEISGMAEPGQGEQKEAQNLGTDSFATKPFYQKMFILFGGILFNLLFAYFSLSLLFMIGAPKTDLLYPLGIVEEQPTIRIIRKNSAADRSGLKIGDEILSINDNSFDNDVKKLRTIMRTLAGQEAKLIIKREGIEQVVTIIPDNIENTGNCNTAPMDVFYEIKSIPEFGFFESIYQGFRATNIYISMVLCSFKNMFSKRDITGMGGPIMVIAETSKGAQKGLKIFLLFLAVISINLAVLNLIPLPILDGGQILFVVIESILGTQLPRLREYIHLVSWVLILGLVMYLTLKDIGILKWLGF